MMLAAPVEVMKMRRKFNRNPIYIAERPNGRLELPLKSCVDEELIGQILNRLRSDLADLNRVMKG